MKFHPVGSEVFHVDRETDRHVTKLVVTFHNFAYMLKNLKTSCWLFRYVYGF
jgi:hypothetical protein